MDGHLQHMVGELYQGQIRASVSFGAETVAVSLPIPPSPGGILSANISIAIGQGRLEVSRDENNCDKVDGLCSVNKTAEVDSGNVVLDGSLYIGGVPQLTPFIRSKLKTTDGYRGCLGVSLFLFNKRTLYFTCICISFCIIFKSNLGV